MDKNAALSGYMVSYIIKLLFLIVLVATTYFLVHTYVSQEVDSFSAETSLFVTGLLYSKEGLSVVDKNTGQVMPGVIDLNKISSLNLDESLKISDSRHLAARMVVQDLGGNTLATIYYNKLWFDRYIQLSSFQGLGATRKAERSLYVLLSDARAYNMLMVSLNSAAPEEYAASQKVLDELAKSKDPTLVQGLLKITVVMPNS